MTDWILRRTSWKFCLTVEALADSTGQREQRGSLQTWKEIAEHLGVSVRTAQLWEKERGLPVRRMEGVRPQVRALTQDLEVWWLSQQRPGQTIQPIDVANSLRVEWDEIWHLASCCLLYASLYGLDFFLEVAFQFDKFRHQALVAGPLLVAWIGLTAGLGLRLGSRMTMNGVKGGFAALFGTFVVSAVIAFGAVTRVLPAEPITILRTLPQTAQAAFLKNVALYFLPLVTLAWLIPFHCVIYLRRQVPLGKTGNVQTLLDSRHATAQPAGAIYIRAGWLWISLFVVGLVSIFATQDLLSKLVPGRFANLFMLLAVAKTTVYLSLGVACVTWYSKALGSIRRVCAEGAANSG
jgi:hypothetical protein